MPESSSTPAPRYDYHRPIKPVKSLLGHWKLSAGIFSVFAVIGVIVAILIPPLYRTEALINVSPVRIRNLDEERRVERYTDWIRNQAVLVKSRPVLKDALLRMGKTESLWLKSGEDPNLAPINLAEALEVSPVSGSNLLEVAMQDKNPKGLAESINAVIDAYMERVKGGNIAGADERAKSLLRRRRELNEEMNSYIARKLQLTKELGILSGQETLENPFARTIRFLRESLASASAERVRTQAVLTATENTLKHLPEAVIRQRAEQRVDADEAIMNESKDLLAMKVELQKDVLTFSDSTQTKAIVKSTITTAKREASKEEDDLERRAREEMLKARMHEVRLREEAFAAAREQAITRIAGQIRADMEEELVNRREDALQAAEIEKRLRAELDAQQQKMEEYIVKFQEAERLQDEILRLQRQLERIDTQLDEYAIEADAPGSIWIETRAVKPERPSHKFRLMALLVVWFLGGCCAIAAPLLLDYLNPWVIFPSDVRAVLHFPPLGWLLEYTDERTRDFTKDQMRRLARSLDQQRASSQQQILALSGVKPQAGVTTIAFSLATELQEIGIRTLVIEANALAPDPIYANDPSTPGLSELLEQKVTLKDCIQTGIMNLPDTVSLGKVPRGHLLPMHLIDTLFPDVRELYDMILIDTPPLLFSADAESIARLVDAYILVVRAEKTTLAEMVRGVTTFDRVGHCPLAVLLNGVHVHKGRGYFAELLKEYEETMQDREKAVAQREAQT